MAQMSGDELLKTVVKVVADEKNETSAVTSWVFMPFQHWV